MGTNFDPQRLDAFFGDANVPEEDKRAVAAQLRSQAAPTPPATSTTTTTTSDTPGALPEPAPTVGGALRETLTDIAKPIAAAATDAIASDVPLTQRIGDVAAMAAPVAYLPATAAQAGIQTAARALGAPHEEAQQMGRFVGTGVGLGSAVAGGVNAVRAVRGTRAALASEAGTGLQRLPSAAEAVRKRVQAQHYDPVAEYMVNSGKVLAPESPEAAKVADAIASAEEKWGSTSAGRTILDKLGRTTIPAEAETVETGLLGARGQQLTRIEGTPPKPPEPITYADLDAAKRMLPSRAKEARGAVDAAIDSLVAGTPAASKLAAGKAAWKLEVVPARRLAAKVERAEGPLDALNLLTSATKGPWRKEIAARTLGGDAAQWDKALDALAALKGSGGGTLQRFGRYLTHHALYAGGAGIVTGHPTAGILGALGTIAVGGAISHAGQAATFLRGGLSGRPAAHALAETISAWGAQQDEAKRGAADDVAAALRGDVQQGASRTPAQAPSTMGTGTYASGPSSPRSGASSLPFDREIGRVASVVGVSPSLLHAVMQIESGGNPSARGPETPDSMGQQAVGLMQLLPSTFAQVAPEVEKLLGRAADIENPWDNLVAGALLYKNYLARTGGNVEQAARYYHGGIDSRAHGPKTAAYGRNVAALAARFGG